MAWKILIYGIVLGIIFSFGAFLSYGYEIKGNPELISDSSFLVQKPRIAQYSAIPAPLALYMLDENLLPVCGCESSGNKEALPVHYETDGKTVRWGRVHPPDKGYCQINTAVHGTEPLGWDVLTPIGNVFYANYLHEKEGLKPWNASKSCWQ